MSATCPCGAALKKPGPTGLCRVCVVKQPKSAETRARMRAAAKLREADGEFQARRVAAVRAGVAASMADPQERARRSDWGRRLGERYGAEMAAAMGPAGSAARMANGRKGSATKLAWCPFEYRSAYRHLNRVIGVPSGEARRIILDQIEADRRVFEQTGRLPQSERSAR